MSLTIKQREAWVEALRSGKYEQTIGRLHRLAEFGYEQGGYCCLGVLACLLGATVDNRFGTHLAIDNRQFTIDDIPLTHTQMDSFVSFNDAQLLSFSQIADQIEADLTLTE